MTCYHNLLPSTEIEIAGITTSAIPLSFMGTTYWTFIVLKLYLHALIGR